MNIPKPSNYVTIDKTINQKLASIRNCTSGTHTVPAVKLMKVVKHYLDDGAAAVAGADELVRRHAQFIARKARDFPLYRLPAAVSTLPMTYFAPFQISDFS